MSRKINQLDPITSTNAKNDSWVLAQADPVSGVAKKITVAQAKEVYGTKSLTYTANGTEGNTLTIAALSGRQILMIMRESGAIFEVGADPESSEYTWDDTDIVLGAAVSMAGERFIILHRTY